jgi:hypothetical protein
MSAAKEVLVFLWGGINENKCGNLMGGKQSLMLGMPCK